MNRQHHPLPRRLGTSALVLAIGIVAVLVPAVGASASTRPQAVAACNGAGVVVWLDTQGNGTAGSIYYNLEFTNLSGHTCRLEGYPGVSAESITGSQIGSPATRDAAHKVVSVTLVEGASATAFLRVTDTANIPKAECRPTRAAGFKVYAPGSTVAKPVPYPFLSCGRLGTPSIEIESVGKFVPA